MLVSSTSAHWLAIEGKQPTINENPEIISKADQTSDSLDPVRHLIGSLFVNSSESLSQTKSLTRKRYNLDSSKIKTSNPHELSLVSSNERFSSPISSTMHSGATNLLQGNHRSMRGFRGTEASGMSSEHPPIRNNVSSGTCSGSDQQSRHRDGPPSNRASPRSVHLRRCQSQSDAVQSRDIDLSDENGQRSARKQVSLL